MALRPVVLAVLMVALAPIASAQETNHAKPDIQIPHRGISQLSNTRYVNVGNIPNIDFDKIDEELLQQIKASQNKQGDSMSKFGEFLEWLRTTKGRESKTGLVDGTNSVFSTPGNISQQCYDDLLTWSSDAESLKPYATKMVSSWGNPTNWLKAVHTGNAKSFGNYELCNEMIDKEDGLPFEGTQYCTLQYPVVEPINLNAYIGTCFPSSCSATDLTTITYIYLYPDLPSYLVYDCFSNRDHPWTAGDIGLLSLLSFLALLVLIGSVYHVTSHNHVTSVLESLKRAVENSKAEKAVENVFEQVVSDKDQIVSTDIDEKCVDEGDTGIKRETLENGISNGYGNGIGNGHANEIGSGVGNGNMNGLKSKSAATEVTHLVIEDDRPKITESRGRTLGRIDQLLMSFSVFHNTEKIFTPSSSNMLSCLNGIRVLSMWWVILGHSMSSPLGVRFDNAAYAFDVSVRTGFWPVSNGTFSVDTFFVLSGFLVTYLTLKELAKKNGRINWFMFYFHRFWCLTPLYMICIGIWTSLSLHLGKGPGKDDLFYYSRQVCKDYWWANLLYIQNLYPYLGSLGSTQCMGWSWYLANDMQFFIISPFIIYLLYRFWKWGVSLIAFLTAVSIGSTAYISWYWGLPMGGSGWYNNRTEVEGVAQDDDFIYTKPWCRIQAYLVGMLLAYIIYKLKGKQFKMNKFVLSFGWLVSTAVCLTVIYGIEASYNGPRTEQWLSVFYIASNRFIFSLCVAWVMFVCITGNGGYINSFLAWSAWSPLAKLNFGVYLFHLILITLAITTMKTTLHFTYMTMIYWFFSNLVGSYLCAYVLALLVESPTVGIEKVLLGRSSQVAVKKEK